MKPIDDLKVEHDAVRLTLRILNTICQDIERTGEISARDQMTGLLEFFKVFVDQSHHGKEEKLLFPALEELGVRRESGPIGVMLSEHQQGRKWVKKMEAAFAQYTAGETAAAMEFIRFATGYSALLNQHIEKENTFLFPLAEAYLSQEKQTEIGEGFDLLETRKIGAGKHELFHDIIATLEIGLFLK